LLNISAVTSPDAGGAGLLCATEPPVGAFFTRRLSHNRFQLDIFESIQSSSREQCGFEGAFLG
jgi:hypothetical protein